MPLTENFSLSAVFQQDSKTKKPRNKRPAPFSIRLSQEERARLAVEAAGAPLGAYIKTKLCGTMPLESNRRKVLTIKDREALAKALALLGRTHFSNNLNQIAHAVNMGILPVTPETEAELRAALSAVLEIRSLLMTALGHKVGKTP